MNRAVCQYAIIRFQPFVETGEFANVGIVLLDGARRYFGFRLQARRYKRITDFFPELEPAVFKAAMRDMQNELERIRNVVMTGNTGVTLITPDHGVASNIFLELIRPRETILRFGELRTLLAGNPEEALEKLFGFYVERNFANKEYRETVMEKDVRQWLVQTHLAEYYVRKEIGDAEFHVTFPFVAVKNEHPAAVIKPLHLAYDDPTRIRERGNDWQFRIRELRKRDYLPQHVLFAVEGPEQPGKLKLAFNDAFDMLEQVGVEVVPYQNRQEILRFALTNAP